MSALRRLKTKFKSHYLSGFFLDRNTFLKADAADVVLASFKGDDGRTVQKPMIILKRVVEMTLDRHGRIVAVENIARLGVWVGALEHALKCFN